MDESSLTPLAFTSFDSYNAKIQASALAATRKAAGLPTDLAFHRSMDRELSESLDAFSQRVLNMANRLLALASTVDQGSKGKGKAKLENQDDVVDNFHSLVVDSVDQLLERTVGPPAVPFLLLSNNLSLTFRIPASTNFGERTKHLLSPSILL